MKRTILSIALLLSVITTLLSSCMVQDDRGRGNRGRHRGHHGGHRGPYDSNGYHHYDRRY
ncbi:hypothetical protein KHS38_06515 [Mucilaginibacter sp. Bleaf8]|uniref:hypothetical protein n=1 Tax=Mucilaginibacter sp. Bleaf8 TaxID=2834430 RepID=UPI001BD01B26|nr:hypothetical protein [Mucilaginibacter sp. Bleaf8]MBS7564054.1 hypothetical protein [Mucilaginibacter sp. Bleaf8]